MSEQPAFPLSWPQGWKRTPAHLREGGQFDGTPDRVRRELLSEVNRLVLGRDARAWSARHLIVLSTNVRLRGDGEPMANAREPDDPGVAVYFRRNDKPVCLACDKYDRVWKNMRAIQKTVEALRGIERWGSSQLLDRAFEGFTALPHRTGPSCWELLGLEPGASEAAILAAWREKAKSAHPDAGGSHEAFTALSEAKDIALATARQNQGAAA